MSDYLLYGDNVTLDGVRLPDYLNNTGINPETEALSQRARLTLDSGYNVWEDGSTEVGVGHPSAEYLPGQVLSDNYGRVDYGGKPSNLYVERGGYSPATQEEMSSKMFGITPPNPTALPGHYTYNGANLGIEHSYQPTNFDFSKMSTMPSYNYMAPDFSSVNIRNPSIPRYTIPNPSAPTAAPRPAQPQTSQRGPIVATANPNGPGYVSIVQQRHQLDPSLANTQYGQDWQRLQELRKQRDDALLKRAGSSVNSDGVYMGGLPDWGIR